MFNFRLKRVFSFLLWDLKTWNEIWFFPLTVSLFSISHSWTWANSSCINISSSSRSLPEQKKLVSLANKIVGKLLVELLRSLMYSNSPRIGSSGTPQVIIFSVDFVIVLENLFYIGEVIFNQSKHDICHEYHKNKSFNRVKWFNVSNAFDKSTKIPTVNSFSSMAFVILSTRSIIAWWVELWNPYWRSVNILFLCILISQLVFYTLAFWHLLSILEKNGCTEIGL